MFIQIALILSVIFQFGAFFIIISLIRKTNFKVSWIAISIGFFLMAVRRLIELFDLSNLDSNADNFFLNSWLAILISALMFVASFYIRQIIIFQVKIDKFRKDNETKVLSAIIKTEEKERQKFAKDLHDGLGPILSSIKMAISAISKPTLIDKNAQIIEKTEIAVDNAIASIKEISNNLSPQILERFGIEKAVKSFIDSLITRENLEIFFNSNLEGRPLNYNIEVVLYRVISELISNTLKHSKATIVDITLFYSTEKLELIYSDNGVGFDLKNSKNTGMGLSNINSRVKSLQGEIDIHSKSNKGFFMKIVLPL